MLDAPYRGPLGAAGRPSGVPLPPDRLPLLRAGRLRKRWRYVGVYAGDAMLCVGLVRIGPALQAFWAIWDRRAGTLHERTVLRPGVVALAPGQARVRDGTTTIELAFDEDGGAPVETVTPYGRGHAWTVKRGALPVRGRWRIGDDERAIDGLAIVDDSAGYPPRRTSWRWSAGVGHDAAGRPVAWNLVDGIHDDPDASERTLWVAGEPRHLPPARFADDLSSVSAGDLDLRFDEEAVRRRRENLLLVRSDYEQPFGTFHGRLADGVELAEGFGVMERHAAVW